MAESLRHVEWHPVHGSFPLGANRGRGFGEASVRILPDASRLRPGDKVILEAKGFEDAVEWKIEFIGGEVGLRLNALPDGRALLALAKEAHSDAIIFLRATSRSNPRQTALGTVQLIIPAEERGHSRPAGPSIRPRRSAWNPFQLFEAFL